MSISPPTQRYGMVAIVFHWLIAGLIVGTFILGLVMTNIAGISPTKLKYYSWHKWAGVTILALAAIRLLWRLFNPPPSYSHTLPAWQRRASHGLHGLLYALMFAVPLSGYFYSLAAGFPIVYFGLFELPSLIGPDPAIRDVLKGLHYWLNMMLAGLVGLHVAAALKHALIDRDGVMARMLPSIKTTEYS
jgi:cytochrome b561